MTTPYDAEVRRSARTLSDIAHVLESVDDASARVNEVLVLTREFVPYSRCALLHKPNAETLPELFVVPEPASDERTRLLRTVLRIFHLLDEAGEGERSTLGDRPLHLALPVMGLDQVIGVLRVEPESGLPYDPRHVRLLSVVAAQLGAYLTMIRLRDEDARHTRELEKAHDFQQLLVGVVSHDLRNPLSVITMVAQQLLKTSSDEKQAKALERALRSAQRANRIISDLLDVTHTRVTGEMTVSKQRVDLLPIVQGLVDDARLTHPAIELVADVGDAYGEWDADRLAQVATNLINNAVQYGARGESIRVQLDTDQDEIRLSVHNRGNPIPEELLEAIFDPFKQGSERRRSKGGGLGLGLFIADQIVRAHGGRIAVRSTASDGTTFVVTLPRQPSADLRPSSWRCAPVAAAVASPLVMVVDDDEDIRAGITDILEQNGYKVVQARNGAEALETLRTGRVTPKLILLDLEMPVMDGETFCNVCHEDPALAAIPVFIISADAGKAIGLARATASAGFLSKPFQYEKLLSVVEQASQPH